MVKNKGVLDYPFKVWPFGNTVLVPVGTGCMPIAVRRLQTGCAKTLATIPTNRFGGRGGEAEFRSNKAKKNMHWSSLGYTS